MYKVLNQKLWRLQHAISKLLLIMRLTTLILIAGILQVSATTRAQKVSLSERNVGLTTILDRISTQTGYDFFFESVNLKNLKNISIKAENEPLKEVLTRILEPQNLSYSIKNNAVVIREREPSILESLAARFREIDVRGRVLDEQGMPLAGASVKVKASNKMMTTNADGRFFLRNVDERAVIQISYLGYQRREIAVTPDLGDIKLALESAELKEVGVNVNTGFQTLSKSRTSGTIAHIGQEVLANRPNTDLSSMLQGVVAGMQAKENANGTVDFTIRGVSTLGSTNANQPVGTTYNQRSPLIVVDGFPLSSSDFSAINPNDVESVDVLKDAAAAAVWGARAANGVIVITTKKGKSQPGLTINVSAFTRISQRPDLDQIYTIANTADQIAYEKLAFSKKIYATAGFFYQGGLFPNDFTITLTQAQQLLFANQYGRLTTAAMNAGLDSLSHIDNRDQIQKYLMRNALTQQYNVSLSNNSERSNTYLSLLFEDNKGRFVGNSYRKYGLNFSNDYKLTRFLTFNFNTFLQYNGNENSGMTREELNGYPTLFGGGISSYEMMLNADGSYVKQAAGGDSGASGPDPYLLSQLPLTKFPYPDWSYNLLRETRGRSLENISYNARIQTGLTLKIIPGLTFDAKMQFERGKTNVENYYSDDTYYVRNRVNTNLQYNNTSKTVGNVYIPKGGILQRIGTDVTNYNYRAQLSYVKDIGNNFNVNAVAGGELVQNRIDGVTNPWLYGYNPATLSSVVPPYGYGSSVDIFPAGNVTGGNLSTIPGGNTTLTYGLDRFVSYFAATDINYNKKYTLTLNIRGDASNYITSDPSLRWSPFWSVGGNWDIKAENFAENIRWMDYLHLRVSYGSSGTADKSTSTQALVNVGTSPNVGTGTITATISSFGNPFLHWERTHITNLGLDFVFFKNKLTGSINAYNKQSSEVTGTVTLPQAYGTTSQKFNNARILNRGIEIQLGTSIKLPADFGYSTSVNYAYNYNEINELYFPTPQNNSLLVPGNAFIEGKPVNSFYTYNYAGVDATGMPQLYGLNGAKVGFNSQTLAVATDGISRGYMNYAGTTIPPHTFGWGNTLSYGNFSLTAQLIGTFGAYFLNPSFNYGSAFVGYGKTAPNRFVRQVLDGDPSVPPLLADPAITLWPRYSPYLTSYIESSSYVQLKELYLNYSLPQKVLGRAKIRNMNFFVQARDLGMIWNNNTYNYNPDFLPGADRPVATYTFGVKFGL